MEQANFVYILQCRDGSLYTGWTCNLEKRVAVHSAGMGAKYTRCLLYTSQSVFCKWGEVTIAMGNYPPVPEGEIVTFYLKNGKTTRKPVDFSVKYDIILENNQVLLQNGETVYQTESNLVELVCDEKGQVK